MWKVESSVSSLVGTWSRIERVSESNFESRSRDEDWRGGPLWGFVA